jgi:hypothetical protein
MCATRPWIRRLRKAQRVDPMPNKPVGESVGSRHDKILSTVLRMALALYTRGWVDA